MRIIQGVLSIFLYATNLIILAVLVLLCAFFYFITPTRRAKHWMQLHVLQKMPFLFALFNSWIMHISMRNRIVIEGAGALNPNGWYVLASNHRSWIDILILSKAFLHRIPPLKFFMKKELLWQLPLAGLACYALNYPFMSRHSHAEIRKNPKLKGKDVEATKKACARMRAFPVTLINFLEGTRFSGAKKLRQQSPYQHLLKPHAGGVATTIQELHDILSGVIDVTIVYQKKTPSLWEFACGNVDRVVVRYECLLIPPELIGDYYNDRQVRANAQQWLNDLWQKKDNVISQYISYEADGSASASDRAV